MPDFKFEKAARKLSKGQEIEIVTEVRENIQECWDFERDNRREAQIDLDFLAGDQWSAAAKAIRGTTRPMLTINQLPQFVRQVTNPTREANIGIKVVPVDDETDPQLAKVFDAIIKQIEDRSTAKSVYVWGNEQQCNCGIGWWQIKTRYVGKATFDQELFLERIENPLSVYCDPAAVLPARDDAMWMCVIEQWPRRRFKRQYPKAVIADVDAPDQHEGSAVASSFHWANKDTVAVAMYFKKVPVKRKLALTQSGKTYDITGKGEGELGQLFDRDPPVAFREAEDFKVEKYLVSGSEVLEGPIDWAGSYIPLIPVIGAEIPLKNGTMRYGVVRFARDPQQILNFAETAAAEAIAMAPKTPWLVTDTMIGAYRDEWNNINTRNQPYLRYTPDPAAVGSAGMPKRESGPEIPAALLSQADRAAENMKRTTGIYEASLGQRSNETSGVAIARRQVEGDTANSHFSDNLMHSLVHTGRVLVDLIPKIYDNSRTLRLRLDDSGKLESVPINSIIVDKDGIPKLENDLTTAMFDVRVTVGKSFVTKRVEALTAMLEFAKTLPPEAQLLFLDVIVKNSDWPEADVLAKRFRTLVPANALHDPDDPNSPPPPDPMDDPMVQAQLDELFAKVEKMKAETRKTNAEAAKVITEIDQADTEMELASQQQIMADWQAGNPTPGEPPPPGMPPPQAEVESSSPVESGVTLGQL